MSAFSLLQFPGLKFFTCRIAQIYLSPCSGCCWIYICAQVYKCSLRLFQRQASAHNVLRIKSPLLCHHLSLLCSLFTSSRKSIFSYYKIALCQIKQLFLISNQQVGEDKYFDLTCDLRSLQWNCTKQLFVQNINLPPSLDQY